MKPTKSSTIGHLKTYGTPARNNNHGLNMVFNQIKDILKPYEMNLNVKSDTGQQYELWTTHVYRNKFRPYDIKTGLQFAGLAISKNNVALYLQYFYLQPESKNELGENIKSKLKGQSCFHITTLTEELIMEIKEAAKKSWDYYLKQKWVTPLDA